MKLRLIMTSCVIALAAQSALADEPMRPNGQALGVMEAIYARCVKADPKAAAKYEQQRHQLVGKGVSEKIMAEVRDSDEYHQSYDATMESLRAVSERDALAACSQAAPPAKLAPAAKSGQQ